MRTGTTAICVIATLLAVAAMAGSRTGGVYSISADVMDGGGQPATSALYRVEASLSMIGGVSGAATPSHVLKSGYAGQLFDLTNVSLSATPLPLNEGSGGQLSAAAQLDDGTANALAGGEITWAPPAYPIAFITPAGAITASVVYADAAASVTGTYLGVTGSITVLVLDTGYDDFGLYAGDQVPDGWQVGYFGVNNPDGAASATNATGQNNLYAYIADLCPTNPNSCFEIVAVSNRPATNTVCFLSSSNRLYWLEWTTNLIAGVWTNTPGVTPVAGNGGMFWLNDTNAASARFYKVSVRVP